MTAMEKIEKCGVVPVVVLDRAEDAVPTAEAMLRGGVNVMEITFRTAAAPDAIRAVACGRGHCDYAGAVPTRGGMRREVYRQPRL